MLKTARVVLSGMGTRAALLLLLAPDPEQSNAGARGAAEQGRHSQNRGSYPPRFHNGPLSTMQPCRPHGAGLGPPARHPQSPVRARGPRTRSQAPPLMPAAPAGCGGKGSCFGEMPRLRGLCPGTCDARRDRARAINCIMCREKPPARTPRAAVSFQALSACLHGLPP